MGSRGADPRKLGEFWKKGPSWLARKEEWPEQPDIIETSQSLSERLKSKEKLLMASERTANELETLLFKHPYKKDVTNNRNHNEIYSEVSRKQDSREKSYIYKVKMVVRVGFGG